MDTRGRITVTLAFLWFAVSTVGCNLNPSLLASKPIVTIGSPAHGAQFNAGQEVLIQATATDANGIARVELWLDGQLMAAAQLPSPQAAQAAVFRWTPTTAGSHLLLVKAVNVTNVMSEPAAVTVNVVAMNAPVPTPIAQVVPTTYPTPAPTMAPPTAALCTNDAVLVEHVTVPDGTNLMPGQAFNKIWRVRNAGTCDWGPGYDLVFVGGEAMTTQSSFVVPVTAPGATADLLIAMVAPTTPSAHTGQWRLRNGKTGLLGATMSVTISVVDTQAQSQPQPQPPAPAADNGANPPAPTPPNISELPNITALPVQKLAKTPTPPMPDLKVTLIAPVIRFATPTPKYGKLVQP